MMIKATTTLLIFAFCLAYSKGQNLDNLGEYISNQVQKSLRPLDNLGSRISSQVNRELAPLENLGERINQQVYRGLEPVRILESILKVKSGSGGTTIATFSPSGRQFIIRDNTLYECGGTISGKDGSCSSDLKRFNFDKNEDFCFASSRSVINNWYCITSSNSIRTSFINGQIICASGDGSPSLLMKVDEYNSMCKNVASSVAYKYFTNRNLQNIGNGLQCSGNNPQVCTFSSALGNDAVNVIQSSGTYVNVGGFNNY